MEMSHLDDPAPMEFGQVPTIVGDDIGHISIIGDFAYFPVFINESDHDGRLVRPIVMKIRLPLSVIPGAIARCWMAIANAGVHRMMIAVRPKLLS